MKNRHRYPDNWEEISRSVRDRADWTCERCGKPCRRPGESWIDFQGRLEKTHGNTSFIEEIADYVWDDETGEWGWVDKPGRFVLTVAHLDHTPANCDPANLKALCAPCHLRYDADDNRRRRAETAFENRVKRDRQTGQLDLWDALA
jgi:hypothetical protein